MVGQINPIPQWGEPAVDTQSGRWSKNWYPWIKVLLERLVETKDTVEDHETRIVDTETSVDSISTTLIDIQADVAGNTSAITSEATARASADSAIASTVTSLSTTVGTNTADIAEVTASVDGIHARWGVALNINNHVTGLVRLDGTTSGSTFTVVADKFIVSHPSAAGTTIQAFTVGLVGGVSTVGINGNLFVDGSINATKLNVTTLSAVSANAGTITAGVLRSADGNFEIDLTNKTIDIVF